MGTQPATARCPAARGIGTGRLGRGAAVAAPGAAVTPGRARIPRTFGTNGAGGPGRTSDGAANG
ncbi:MAG: hypothetical protein EBS51_00095 [Planctomycetia bacterium]|nr:hypothetical protein [Planctomycetia bacterium]